MRQRFKRFMGRVVIVGLLGLLSEAAGARPVAQSAGRHVVVAVVDDKTGRPVTGLSAASFAVREDDVDCQVARVSAAAGPIALAFFLDTTRWAAGDIGEMRQAVRSFLAGFLGAHTGSSAALWEFAGAERQVVPFTGSAARLEAGLASLAPPAPVPAAAASTTGAGSELLAGIADAASRLAGRPEPRRVIVSIDAARSPESSAVSGAQLEPALRAARAQWFGVSSPTRPTRSPGATRSSTCCARRAAV
jgi:hypothetical protein